MVTELNGIVVGPLATVHEALECLDTTEIAAAILDGRLQDRDISPIAFRLAEAGVPFVVYTATGLPAEVQELWPDLLVLLKPTPLQIIALRLNEEIKKCQPMNLKTKQNSP